MKLWRQSASFAPRRSGFDSRRLHYCLRSVNGKHAPFVRPRCGFDSCRRLLRGRSSEGRAWSAPACDADSEVVRLCRATACFCHSGEARSIRVVRFVGPWCKRQHGELQPRRSGFESWRACASCERTAHPMLALSGAARPCCRPRRQHWLSGVSLERHQLGSRATWIGSRHDAGEPTRSRSPSRLEGAEPPRHPSVQNSGICPELGDRLGPSGPRRTSGRCSRA
jgi:hypothetical protein